MTRPNTPCFRRLFVCVLMWTVMATGCEKEKTAAKHSAATELEMMCETMEAFRRDPGDPATRAERLMRAIAEQTFTPQIKELLSRFETLRLGRCQAMAETAEEVGLGEGWACPAFCPFQAQYGFDAMHELELVGLAREPEALKARPTLILARDAVRTSRKRVTQLDEGRFPEGEPPAALLGALSAAEGQTLVLLVDDMLPAQTLMEVLDAARAEGVRESAVVGVVTNLKYSGVGTAGLHSMQSSKPVPLKSATEEPAELLVRISEEGFTVLRGGHLLPPAGDCDGEEVTICNASSPVLRLVIGKRWPGQHHDWASLYNALLPLAEEGVKEITISAPGEMAASMLLRAHDLLSRRWLLEGKPITRMGNSDMDTLRAGAPLFDISLAASP